MTSALPIVPVLTPMESEKRDTGTTATDWLRSRHRYGL